MVAALDADRRERAQQLLPQARPALRRRDVEVLEPDAVRAGPRREGQEPDGAPHDLAVDLGHVREHRRFAVGREQRVGQVLGRGVDLVQRLLVLGELTDQAQDDGHVARDGGPDAGGGGRHTGNVRTDGHNGRMTTTRRIDTWLTDMDGVLVHEDDPIPGAAEFIETLKASGRSFLVLTNNSIFTPRDLRARLLRSGIDVPEDAIWTSALATADFLADQRPGGTAYVVGEAGLTTALHDVGYVMSDRDPDYVVLGETRTYSFEAITKAIRLIMGGARFIATNPDPSGPSAAGLLPATGSVAALISTATGRRPYFIGKPNPLMMRSALNRLEAHSETTVMVGDRMDTDIISGLEAGLRTVLVSTGSTRPEQVEHFPYRPTRVVDSIADLVPLVTELAEGEGVE